MALGKKCRNCTTPKRGRLVGDGDEGLELGLVRYARAFGRKRIVISNNGDGFGLSPKTPLKKRCGRRNMAAVDRECSAASSSSSSSPLEALPQDILIRILCGVDHDDLNQLSHVSKSIREATLIAKQCHFAYSTPKKVRAFRAAIDLGHHDSSNVDEIEAPDAPKQSRPIKSRLFGKKLNSIAVNLFD